MALTQLPNPPLRTQPDTFAAQMENFLVALPTLANEFNQASSVADLATRSSSTTSNTISTGSKTFTVQTGLGFLPGHPIRVANTPAPTNYMDGIVTSYTSGTGALVINVTSISGTGTFAAWSVMVLPGGGNFASLTSSNKFTSRQVFANEVTIASAATIDFVTGNSNQFAITGSANISAVTMEQGAVVIARFAGGATLVNSASLQVDGNANYTTATGDVVTFTSNGSFVRAEISNLSGQPLFLTTATTDPTYAANNGNPASTNWVKGYAATLPSGFSNIQVFTASGTFTVPAGVTKVKATVVGGGGGGGGAQTTTSASATAGSGGFGAVAIGVFSVTGQPSVAVTVGASGTAGAVQGTGGTGGTSSFGAFASATGGAGGAGTLNAVGANGAGGTASGGAFNFNGPSGGTNSFTPLGFGSQTSVNRVANSVPPPPFGFGSGGYGGTLGATNVSVGGVAGNAGLVIVEW